MSDVPIQYRDSLQHEIINTLLYFDIFNYPLRADEVFRFLKIKAHSVDLVSATLQTLVASGILHRHDNLYGIQADAANAIRRVQGNRLAEKLMPVAHAKSALISKFPFVRAVMASGSLSKGYMDEKSDLDFFIVTAPGRLWIARTLLVTYKRLFLFNSHKYFCVNYFVDELRPQIEEHNLFTATELATVIPLQGGSHYLNLIEKNEWLIDFFPNFTPLPTTFAGTVGKNWFQRAAEWAIDLFHPEKLEHYFWKITFNRWTKLYRKDYSENDFNVAFKSKEYASKNHPKNYQKKVMELYQSKVEAFRYSQLPVAQPKADVSALV